MELRFYMRQTQYHAVTGTSSVPQNSPVIYAGSSPATLTPVVGVVPFGQYIDFTGDAGNLDKIQLTWTTDRDIQGASVAGELLPKKSTSNAISLEGKAYLFVKDWLITNVAAPLNAIDVKVEHVGCGTYDEYVIKASDITWCEDTVCQFDVTIKQKDPSIQCLQQWLVADNWQGWFQGQPANGKKHPRFVYCNEVKPNGMMVLEWWFSTIIFTILFILYPIFSVIYDIVSLVVWFITMVVDVIGWLLTLGQWGGFPSLPDLISPLGIYSQVGSFYVESSGCGRMHPAPLIRDYIDNICGKCGIHVDNITDPIFHSRTITINAGSGMKENAPNPYYNACYLNAPIERGIRVQHGLFSSSGDINLTDYYIEDNQPQLALDQFLDQIKAVFNAEWQVKSVGGVPTLYFWRKDWYKLGSALYDFTDNGADRNKVIDGICFNWLDKTQFASMRGLYAQDPADLCGNESLMYMNDIISLGDSTNNPSVQGMLDKTGQVGGARFRLDGASDDYIMNALQVMVNGAALNPTIIFMVNTEIVRAMKRYADYALLMSGETCTLPKIIIWDDQYSAKEGFDAFDIAKAIRTKNTVPGNGSSLPAPEPNPLYNPQGVQWGVEHPPSTYVEGSGLSFGSSPPGKYTVQEYLGIDLYAMPAELCNYPMFFQPGYKDNIYDWFHWIDDPRYNPTLNLQFDLKIDLCCEDLTKLKVFNDASEVRLGDKVSLPLGYYNEGTITEITVSYDSGAEDVGKYIELKGTV